MGIHQTCFGPPRYPLSCRGRVPYLPYSCLLREDQHLQQTIQARGSSLRLGSSLFSHLVRFSHSGLVSPNFLLNNSLLTSLMATSTLDSSDSTLSSQSASSRLF